MMRHATEYHPGIGRLAFIAAFVGAPLLCVGMFTGAATAGSLPSEAKVPFTVSSLLLVAGVQLVAVIKRLQNVGYREAYALLFFVPVGNVFLLYWCSALPEGFALTKRLDDAGVAVKSIFALSLIGLILFVAFMTFQDLSP